MDKDRLEMHLQASLDWFAISGVMDPSDGRWGLAERVLLTENNEALDKALTSFPQYTKYEGYVILEHRRADCNFESAWLYWLAAKVFGREDYRQTCIRLLHYLYHRSGMRNLSDKSLPLGLWRWATPCWTPAYWQDDNAWCCVAALAMSADAELATMFPLRESALQIADALADHLEPSLPSTLEKQTSFWMGEPASPHWGALMAMAMGCAHGVAPKDNYRAGVDTMLAFLETKRENFTSSEIAYMALATSVLAGWLNDAAMLDQARRWADMLIERMGPRGNLPSQWYESPAGEHLVDTIYVQNWATLAWLNLAALTGEESYRTARDTSLTLLMDIQDEDPGLHLKGCWRGMYDMNANAWGGGDCYEGGANSVYTGWTNAPIAMAIAMVLLDESMIPQAS